jgi:hypothetical protein
VSKEARKFDSYLQGAEVLLLSAADLSRDMEAGEEVRNALHHLNLARKKPFARRQMNAGIVCDAENGPCACGAWHGSEEK